MNINSIYRNDNNDANSISKSIDSNDNSTRKDVDHTAGNQKLTLDNLLVPKQSIERSPSVALHSLDSAVEITLRTFACSLIQKSAVLLELPQEASATAQIIFQRFYYQKSLLNNDYLHTSMACISIASKVEEYIRSLREIIVVFNLVYSAYKNKPLKHIELEKYKILKQKVHRQEFRVLAALGYNVRVNNPHKIIFFYLKLLNLIDNMPLVQSAWNFMNDALRSHNVFPMFLPEIIASACIALAARNQFIPLPNRPSWMPLFGCCVSIDEILEIISKIFQVYKVNISYEAVQYAENELLVKLDSFNRSTSRNRRNQNSNLNASINSHNHDADANDIKKRKHNNDDSNFKSNDSFRNRYKKYKSSNNYDNRVDNDSNSVEKVYKTRSNHDRSEKYQNRNDSTYSTENSSRDRSKKSRKNNDHSRHAAVSDRRRDTNYRNDYDRNKKRDNSNLSTNKYKELKSKFHDSYREKSRNDARRDNHGHDKSHRYAYKKENPYDNYGKSIEDDKISNFQISDKLSASNDHKNSNIVQKTGNDENNNNNN